MKSLVIKSSQLSQLQASGIGVVEGVFLRSQTLLNRHIVKMYAQQVHTQLLGRRVLAPSVSRCLVGRQSAPSCLRPSARRSSMKAQAVQAPAKRKLPTQGLDYKPKDDDTAVQTDIVKKLAYVVGADAQSISDREAYQGVALSVRERLIERFNKTQEHWRCAVDPGCTLLKCRCRAYHFCLTCAA